MHVLLSQRPPTQDGYYLVRFGEVGGLHLVLIQTELDGRRVILPDTCPFKKKGNKKALKCADGSAPLYFHEFPSMAWWSEIITV